MSIPVVLKSGEERNVAKDELQYLLYTQQVWFFERSDGWMVVGRDEMREKEPQLIENDRRSHAVFALEY